ncbi:TPA: hypothetical protein DIC40_05530 [Patescibacteria group bacterium]|nr:hypothetical protein [Candidatus Gracilibacteria bacterium]
MISNFYHNFIVSFFNIIHLYVDTVIRSFIIKSFKNCFAPVHLSILKYINTTIMANKTTAVSKIKIIDTIIHDTKNNISIRYNFLFMYNLCIIFYKKQAVLANGKLNDKKIRLYYMIILL